MIQKIGPGEPEDIRRKGQEPAFEGIDISKLSNGKEVAETSRPIEQGIVTPQQIKEKKLTAAQLDFLTELEQHVAIMGKHYDASLIDPRKAPSLNQYAKEHIDLLFEEAKAHAEAAKRWGEFTDGVFLIPETPLEMGETYFGRPLQRYLSDLIEVDETLIKIAEGTATAVLLFKIPSTLGKGGNLIYKKTVLNLFENQIALAEEKLKEFPDPDEEKRLGELKKWLTLQYEDLFNEAKSFGIETLAYVPKGIETSAKLVGQYSDVFQVGNLWFLGFATVAANSYAVHKARTGVQTHKEWVEQFREKPRIKETIASDVITVHEGIEGKEEKIEVPKAPPEMVVDVKQLLKKRQDAREKHIKNAEIEFKLWANELSASNKSFEDIEREFKSKGVDLTAFSITDKSALEEILARELNEESEAINAIRQMIGSYAEHKATITVLTRNGLQALAEKKHKIERKFLNFRLTKSSISLTLSTLFLSAAIVLKTLAIVGVIAVPTAALAWSGVGLVVIGVALIIIGLVLLHHYKPNFFSELIRGVQTRIALNNIPRAYHSFQQNLKNTEKLKKELKLSHFSSRVEVLKGILSERNIKEAKNLPEEAKPLLKKFKGDIDKLLESGEYGKLLEELENIQKQEAQTTKQEIVKLDKQIEETKKNVEKWEIKIKPLKQQLVRAAWKDLEKATRTGKIEETLLEGILESDELLNEPMKTILRDQMGVDLVKLREQNREDKEKLKTEVKEALGTFFTMDESQMLAFIKGQKTKFDFGELGGSTA